MMRRLKRRKEAAPLENQPRARRQTVIKWVYLTSIALLFVWLADTFVGDLFFLRSGGIVIGEQAAVATEFPVTVRDVHVRTGDEVKAGSVVVVASSQAVTESIARLTAELGTLEAQRAELSVRGQSVEALIAMASERSDIAAGARKEIEKLWKQGYLPLDKRTAAAESEFRGRQDLESLLAERQIVSSEMASLTAALSDAEAAIEELKALYDGGRFRAPIDGVVSAIAVHKGAVANVGEPMAQIYSQNRYVLAYVPTGALYSVAAGDSVHLLTGLDSYEGVISSIEPYAAALPSEFQRAFTPVERQQVIRISFREGEAPPPLFTKVEVHGETCIRMMLGNAWRQVWSLF
jgi:multidrug resistance efflux pump